MISVYEKKQIIYPSLADASGKLSYFDAFDLFMDIASEHAEALGVGMNEMAKNDLFWLTVKTKILFHRRPRIGEPVIMHTWAEKPENVRVIRYYDMVDGTGEVIVSGKTDWAVLNYKTNKIVNIEEFYPGEYEVTKEASMEEPFIRIPDHFEDITPFSEYRVRSTDIDLGQHMNNTAYVKTLIGCFSSKELKEMNIKSIDIVFRNPCFEGDLLSFQKKQTEDGLQIRASKEDKTIVLVNIV